MKFKRLTDLEVVDLAEYLNEYIKQVGKENVTLYIGCDSQNKSEWTSYATTVVLHIGNTGCHVLTNAKELDLESMTFGLDCGKKLNVQ